MIRRILARCFPPRASLVTQDLERVLVSCRLTRAQIEALGDKYHTNNIPAALVSAVEDALR